jgi:hypothetical protein
VSADAGDDAAAPIAVLRRIAALVEAYAPPHDAMPFVAAVRRYEAGAAHGLTLDAALGLAARQGASGWWTIEARRRRDLKLRALRVTRFAHLKREEAARAIALLAQCRPSLFREYPAPRSVRHIVRILARR